MLLISTDVVILQDLCSFFQTYQNTITSLSSIIKVTGYLELYDCIYVYIYATKTGILKS